MAESDLCPTCHASRKGIRTDSGEPYYAGGTCSQECARTEQLKAAIGGGTQMLDHNLGQVIQRLGDVWASLQQIIAIRN